MIITMARKNYSMEFRQQAVDLYETTPGATLKQIAGELGVSRGTLSLWVKDLGNGVRSGEEPVTVKPTVGESTATRIARLEAENARLRADKARVETERDILRKAAKYFAGETNW
ncbi:transposase [Vibrio aestuarianus]|nr:transposase [Vibrio aestuarianus subsp. cardii]